jgi:peptidoglycan/LPS O-acetylase OafA/YrhL
MLKNSRIAVLDGYRALAILLVLFFHYTVRWASPYDPTNHFPAGALFNGDAVALYGGFGVEFFFVISGFVILMTLEKCKSILDFAVRRIARLWPSLIVAATLTTIAMPFIGFPEWRVTFPSYLVSIFLAPPWVVGHFLHERGLSWVDGAYWSLFVEIQFYALACLCYWLARKNFVRLWIVLQACVTALTILVSHSHSLAAFAEELVFFPYFPYFTMGICLYEFYHGGALRNQAIAGAILAAITVLMSSALKWNIWEHYAATGNIVTNILIFAFFILFALESRLVNIFAWRPVAVLGQASYALYLLHQFIGVSFMRVFVAHGIPYLGSMLMVTTGMIGLSVLIFYQVENPAKRLILTRLHPWVSETQNDVSWIRFDRTSRLAPVQP